ncbi:MAG: hypothetical protein HY868_16045 [Chloroflexi bacterium]|nr:hypothetical protein [Chloroflexota bacterium]
MPNVIELDIAGIRVALDIADAAMRVKVRERYAAFIVAEGRPQVRVRVEVVAEARFVPARPGPWVIETALAGNRLTYRSYFDAGWVDLDGGEGAVKIAPHADVENFLRVLYAHLCLRAGGLLLHAAGVVRDQAGYVFFGESGSGKTTTARLSLDLGCAVLSDDLVILKKDGDSFRVFGVPFRGEMMEAPRTNLSAHLAGLYALAKDTRHYLAPVVSSRGVSRLAACVPFVMSQPANAGRVMKICADLVAHVPVRELHFSRDDGFWKVIDELD